MTEYCYLDPDVYANENSKQDCELAGFARLTDRLKKYFPRLPIIVLLDNLYACESVIENLKSKNWQFMIKLPAKLKSLYNQLIEYSSSTSAQYKRYHRERAQQFFWINGATYRGQDIHLVLCNDQWQEVSRISGEKITKRSCHTWISSMALSDENVHVLCNLAARNRSFIEDSFNTEKNRGYQYKHAFSYDWNAMKAFHYLMRLAHAINALSEFTKRLKKYIKSIGVMKTLKRIRDGIEHCWISSECINEELKKLPLLKFDFTQ